MTQSSPPDYQEDHEAAGQCQDQSAKKHIVTHNPKARMGNWCSLYVGPNFNFTLDPTWNRNYYKYFLVIRNTQQSFHELLLKSKNKSSADFYISEKCRKLKTCLWPSCGGHMHYHG